MSIDGSSDGKTAMVAKIPPEPRHVSATDARVRFGELLDAVRNGGETVIVEKSGEPLAAVIPIAEYRRLTRRVLPQEFWEGTRKVAEELERNLAGRPYPDERDLIDAGRE
jgi:prevent-host-death family protein